MSWKMEVEHLEQVYPMGVAVRDEGAICLADPVVEPPQRGQVVARLGERVSTLCSLRRAAVDVGDRTMALASSIKSKS